LAAHATRFTARARGHRAVREQRTRRGTVLNVAAAAYQR
jgi:hypothetical protein